MAIKLILILCITVWAQQKHHYIYATGDTILPTTWIKTPRKLKETRGYESRYFYYSNKKLDSCRTINPNKKTNYVIYRHNSRLHFQGTFMGKKISFTKKIDSAPWYQTSHDLSHFAQSQSNAMVDYWVVRPSDNKVFKMRATKEEKKESPELQYIRISPVGAFYALWKAHLSFQKEDGLFYQYRAVHGKWTNPETVVTLVN